MDEEFAGKPAETQDEVLARLATEIRECVNRGAAGAITAGIKLIEAKRLCRMASGCRGCVCTAS